MIYPVKICDAKGKVKKMVSTSTLTDEHWKNFYSDEDNIGLMNGPKNAVIPNHIKKKMNTEFAGLYDLSFSFIN